MLSTTSQYALRALSCLAGNPDSVTLGRDLSARTGVPATYLAKIMLALRHAGIVTATRGSHGGYCLARPPSSIKLMEVVELFEGESARPRCLLGHADCSDRHPCPAHALWKDVRAHYIAFLEQTSVADISKQQRRAHSHR